MELYVLGEQIRVDVVKLRRDVLALPARINVIAEKEDELEQSLVSQFVQLITHLLLCFLPGPGVPEEGHVDNPFGQLLRSGCDREGRKRDEEARDNNRLSGSHDRSSMLSEPAHGPLAVIPALLRSVRA